MPRLVRIGATIALLAVAILGASAQRAYAQQGWATSPSSLSPVNISGGGADVAFDAAGNGFAVWVQADGTIRSIWLARYEPEIGTWRLPGTQLSSAGQDTMAPRVGVDGAGNAIVAWVRQAGGTYYLESRRYATATDTWSAPAAIATVGVGGAGPDLAVTPSGDAIVAWTSIESVTPLVMTVQAARFAAGTGLWTAAGPISAPGETAFFARVAITPGGDAVAAWSQEVTDTTEAIVATRFVAATSTWQAPVVLSAAANFAEHATVAIDISGNAVVAWARASNTEVARFDTGTSTWSPALTISSGPSVDGPALVSDGSGNATVVWRLMSGTVETRRYDASQSTWLATQAIPGAAAVGEPAAAVDTAGNVVAFWPRASIGGGTGEGARFVRATGTWTAPQPVATPGGAPMLIEMAADGAGNVSVVWNTNAQTSSVYTLRWSGAPRAPTLGATTVTATSVLVHVTAPSHDEAAFAATGYEYAISLGPWTPAPLSSPVVIPRPPVGTWYVTVRAVNAAGAGAWMGVPVSIPPDPPTNLAVTAVQGSQVTLAWEAPASGSAGLTYVVEGGVAPGQVLASIPTGSGLATFTFTAPDGRFFVRVRSDYYQLRSAPSNEVVLGVNLAAPPSPPAHLLGTVQGSSLALSWTPTFAGGAPASVSLVVSGPVSGVVPLGAAESFQYANVPPGTYTFHVVATNAAGSSAPSNTLTLAFPAACTGVPGPPLRLAVDRSGRTLSLAWSPPETGGAVTAYLLTVSGAFSGVFPLTGRTIGAPVAPGAYTFRLQAANACGASAATTPVTVVVP